MARNCFRPNRRLAPRRAIRLAAAFCLAAPLFPLPATAQEKPSLAIVFDATNSMWGQIDGANKVTVLRQALGRAFAAAAGKLDIGLVSYGSSEANACSVNIVTPLGPVDTAEYSLAITQVALGKGGTPLGRALAEAADLAEYRTRQATILIIADGPDNCRTDPCGQAARLKAEAPGLTVHAIGFDRRNKDQLDKLACMAEQTGGRYFPAGSEAELDQALAAVVALASTGGAIAAADPPTPAPKGPKEPPPAESQVPESPQDPGEPPVPEVRPDPAAETEPSAEEKIQQQLAKAETAAVGTLRLAASLTPELPPLTAGLVWRIFSAAPDASGSFKVVARHQEANPVVPLRAGDYIVHVAYGRASTTKQITIKEGVLDETIVLNAGGLRLSAVRSDGRKIAGNAVSFAVYAAEQDQFGERKLILPSAAPDKIIRLNAGAYHVVSQFGDANAVVRADIAVEAGKLAEAVVHHRAAKVTLKLVNEPGGEALADTSWSVLSLEGDLVTESVGAFPSHILAPGEYTIIARHEGKAYSREYRVELGYDQEVEIVAGTGEGR